jgi:hydrogenase maturation protease
VSMAGPSLQAINPSPLVIGFGNVLLRDDGAGVQLMEQLQSNWGASAACFVDGGTMSFSLLPYFEATDAVLVIDAADLASPPGTIQLYEGASMDRFLQIVRRRTVHEVGLIDLMDMARVSDCLPSRRALLCIQPENVEWGTDLSACVAHALVPAALVARNLISRWNET